MFASIIGEQGLKLRYRRLSGRDFRLFPLT